MPDFDRIVSRDLDRGVWLALTAEFLGTSLLQFLLGGFSYPRSNLAYGLAYTALVYAMQQLSGGHLNPALTIATIISGHVHWIIASMYIVAQILGALLGSVLVALFVPGVHIWKHDPYPSVCVHPHGVTNLELFGWELLATLILLHVVYGTLYGRPGNGNLHPLAAGAALYAGAEAASKYTGASLNPALLIGASLVFACTWRHIWVYLLAQLLASAIVGVVGAALYGQGAAFDEGGLGVLGTAVDRSRRREGTILEEAREALLPERDPMVSAPV